jgi:hypothetical protein
MGWHGVRWNFEIKTVSRHNYSYIRRETKLRLKVMKFNLKVLIALVVLVGAAFWGVSSVRTVSYTGSDLNIDIGNGPVTVTNPSDQSLAVQLVGAQTASFTVSSSIEEVSGRSAREGSGRGATQLFEFELPPGVSEITVGRGSDVNFVSSSDVSLEALVQPLSAESTQTTIIMAAVVILGALLYISRTTGHGWINRFRNMNTPVPVPQPATVPATADSNKGRDGRMYTDA